jgi:hypothetical protein
MRVTRTTNPLHLEDLEPHRFEDLIRQLIHGYRNWVSIEALGRAGSDDGIDILAVEAVDELAVDVDEDVEDAEPIPHKTRTWIIQCKRERSIAPKKAARYVAESLKGKTDIYGFILAAAADFSKKARDAFRAAIAETSVREAHMWGKAELEDKLFLPENDHLLFAYCGISLSLRRRSVGAKIARALAIKRKLMKVIPLREGTGRRVLLRDPAAEDYPFIKDLASFRKAPRWLYFEPAGHAPPDHIRFVVRRAQGWFNQTTGEWAIPEMRRLTPENDRLWGMPDDQWSVEDEEDKQFRETVPAEHQATIEISRILSYSRVLVVDEIGDAFNEGPHLVVEWDQERGFFEPEYIVAIARDGSWEGVRLDMNKNRDLP